MTSPEGFSGIEKGDSSPCISQLDTGVTDNAHKTSPMDRLTALSFQCRRSIMAREISRISRMKRPGGKINGVIVFFSTNMVLTVLFQWFER